MATPRKHPKTGIYWLRRAVPTDLRAGVGKREEKISLKTRDPVEAKRSFIAEMAKIEERWARLREPERTLTANELHKISLNAYQWCFDQGGSPGISWDVSLGDQLWAEDTFDIATAFSPEVIARDARKHQHRAWCTQRASEFLMSSGVKVGDGDRLNVAKAIAQGAHRSTLALQAQGRGDFSPDPFLVQTVAVKNPGAGSVGKSVPFKALIDGWVAEKAPSSKTLYSWRKVFDQLRSFIGHDNAADVTADDLLRWKASLLEQGLRTKTIRDSKLAPLRAILQWGFDNRKLAENPAARITIDVRAKLTERIRGFTDEEAVLILSNAAESTDPVRRWIPLLCAYSGARLSEVCQLRKEDIVSEQGVWCMKLAPEAGSLKNVSSERLVPLHPAVVQAGFLAFSSGSKDGPLFSVLSADRFGNRGGTGTKLIGRWVRSLGITDARISPSHSWRHRFKTLGRRHGIQMDISDAITGHAGKTVADRYGEFPIEALYRELVKIPTISLRTSAHENRSEI